MIAGGDQYVKIEPASSREQYKWMEQFVAMVEFSQIIKVSALCSNIFQMSLKKSMPIMKQRQIVGTKIRTTIVAHQSYYQEMKSLAQLMLK